MYSFLDLELVCCSMSSSNCCCLTCIQISQEAGHMVWYAHLFTNFPLCRCFSGTLLLFQWSNRCWQFDLWFLCLFSIQFEHLEVHGRVLLKPGLENFEHVVASLWDECNCVVVWTFFGIALLWDWNENWPFPVLWPLLSLPDLLTYWVQHFHSIIFQDLK